MMALTYAVQTHRVNPMSQLYLWVATRVDTPKLVSRMIHAQETHEIVKMVVAEYDYRDTLPCGKRVRDAIREYNGLTFLEHLCKPGVVYQRRKPTATGLSKTRYQIVLMWNSTPEVADVPRTPPAKAELTQPPPLKRDDEDTDDESDYADMPGLVAASSSFSPIQRVHHPSFDLDETK